jgi:glycosyltransferase involved in cell wall biosynthesis
MNATPRISVILPSLDMGRFLRQGIASVMRQDVPVHEILMIDSRSEDETLDVARALIAEGVPLKLLEDERRGPGPARNIGLEAAEGELITFLDADDLWPAGKLARQLARLQAAPRVEMVSGRVLYFDRLDEATLTPAADARTQQMAHVHLGACVYRREVFDAVGGFDPEFLYGEDVDLLLRLRDAGIPYVIQDTVTLYYRKHDNSMMTTVANEARMKRDFSRAVLKSMQRRRAAGLPAQGPEPFADFLETPGGYRPGEDRS